MRNLTQLAFKIILWASLPLTATGAFAKSFDVLPGLVRVTSTYRDELSPDDSYTFKGTGFVVSAYGRYFVVTASHLSQGGITEERNSLMVESYDSKSKQFMPLEVETRLAQNLSDVEVILLKTKKFADPLALLKASEGTMPYFAEAHPLGWLALTAKTLDMIDSRNFNDRSTFPLGLETLLPNALDVPASSALEDARPADIDRLFKEPISFFFKQRLERGYDTTSTEIVASSKIAPGMSGSPLIDMSLNMPRITGSASSLSRGFDESWLASDYSITFVLARLVKIMRATNSGELIVDDWHLLGPVYWYCRGGLLYRKGMHAETKLHFSEIAPEISSGSAKQPSGNGTKSDGGNGTKSDGGNGTKSDGGNGTTTTHAFESHKFKPGVLFGKAATSLKKVVLFEFDANGKTHLMEADMQSLRLMFQLTQPSNTFSYKFKIHRTYGPSDNLLSPIVSRLERLWGKSRGRIWRKDFDSEKWLPLTDYRARPAAVVIREFREEDIPIRLNVSVDFGDDALSFDLGPQGELIGTNKLFYPEVAVVSPTTGKRYDVQLSGFLVTSPSAYNVYYDSLVANNYPDVAPNPEIRFSIRSTETEYFFWH